MERVRDGRVLKRLTVYMPPDLAKRLHLACIEDESNMSDTIVALVERYLADRDRRR